MNEFDWWSAPSRGRMVVGVTDVSSTRGVDKAMVVFRLVGIT